MAAAFCGSADTLQKSMTALTANYPQSFAAKSLYIPNLTAAAQWQSGNLAGAVATLQANKANDPQSLAPYLRGVIRVAAKQGPQAVTDFQEVMDHRGATVLVTPEAYPLAQIGIARAYASSGDAINSAANYTKFLNLWTSPDTGSPVVQEAQAHSR